MKTITYSPSIYTYHIDFIGHVNNAVYIQWMEIGRTKLLEAIGMPIEEIANDGIAPVLVRTQIDYKIPLHLGDRVRIEMWLSVLRGASAVLEFRFSNQDGELVASGTQKGLFIATDTGRPMRLSKDIRALFEPFVAGSGE